MIHLDTVNLICDIDAINDIPKGNIDKYFKKETTEEDGKKRISHLLRSSVFGMSQMQIRNDQIRVKVSAKIIFDEYLNGISKNNIEKVIEGINSHRIVKLDSQYFIENAFILSADVTENIKPSDVKQTIIDYEIYSANKKYTVKPYGKSGITIIRKTPTIDERIIIYDKEKEISKNVKSNKILWQYVKPSDAKGILRAERNIRSFEDLREAFRLNKGEKIKLLDVLNSNMNPIFDILTKMYDFEKPIDAIKSKDFNMIEYRKYLDKSGLPLKEIDIRVNSRLLLESYNNDILLIKDILEESGKHSTVYRKIKEIEAEKKRKDYENLPSGMKNIIEFRDLLKAS